MTRIAPVRLAFNPRILWFDAGELAIAPGEHLVVQTARGTEYATAAAEVFEATEEEIASLKSPLKPVMRIATEEDSLQAARMEKLSAEALPIFRQMAELSNADMRPVSVEYLLDGDKAIFYFEAEERIDFRDLVRQLASRFHVRVDMRQIGVRDEARMIGGLGHCGQELCCARLGGDFNPVSIRMAKEQDLSLNPQKISGSCGRLMCCLRYEYEAYKDFRSRAPKQNATIQTPEGPAKVVSLDVPREIVTVKCAGEDVKPVKVPLADFDEPERSGGEEGNARPNSIGEDAWERAKNVDPLRDRSDAFFLTSQFTQDDKVGGNRAVHHPSAPASDDERRKRTRRSKSNKSYSAEVSSDDALRDEAKHERKRRRRSTKLEAQAGVAAADSGESGSSSEGARGDKSNRSGKATARPGRNSSGLRNASPQRAAESEQQRKSTAKGQKGGGRDRKPTREDGRPRGMQPRKRSSKSNAASSQGETARPNASSRSAAPAARPQQDGAQAPRQHRKPRSRNRKPGDSNAADKGNAGTKE